MAYIPPHEMQEMNRRSHEDMLLADPSHILSALGIDYKTSHGGTQYLFKMHNENNASTRFKLFSNGSWGFKNFATEESGSLVTFIEKYMNVPREVAMQYYYDNMPGAVNYFKEALDLIEDNKYQEIISKKIEEIEKKKLDNINNSKLNSSDSRVLAAYPIYKTNEKANDFLKNRGLDKTPPFILTIKGESEKLNQETGEIKVNTTFGIGVMFGDAKANQKLLEDKKELSEDAGGDIHYYKPFETKNGIQKTMSFNNKDITYWKNGSKDLMIFESKFDAAAAYCHNPDIWKKCDVVIANGVGTASRIADFINTNSYESISNYNQNDMAAIVFSYNILKNIDISAKDAYKFIKYEKSEIGEDINDLYKKGVDLDSRFEKTFQAQVNYQKEYLEEKLSKLKPSTLVKQHIKKIDESIISIVDSVKRNELHKIKDKLHEDELIRYEQLKEGGFIADVNSYQLFKLNTGKDVDSLKIIKEIDVLTKDLDYLSKLINKKGEIMPSIENIEDLKTQLDKIDLSSDDLYENVDTITEYLKKNKSSMVIKTVEDWVQKSCENNTEDTIEKAKLFYFADFEEAVGKTFSYLDIGKNLNTDNVIAPSLVIKQPIATEDIEDEVMIDSSLEDDKSNIYDIENDIPQNIENDIPQDIEIDIDEEKVEEPKATIVSDSNKVETPKKEEDIKNTVKPSLVIGEELNKELKAKSIINPKKEMECFKDTLKIVQSKVSDLSNIINDKDGFEIPLESKKEALKDSKGLCSDIMQRLNNPQFIDAIKNSTNDEKKELASSREEIYSLARSNVEKIVENENTLSVQKEQVPLVKITVASDEIIEKMNLICKKISSSVDIMKSTLDEIKKKNNEIDVQNELTITR